MPKAGYGQPPKATQSYELVQLLRMNGAHVTREPDGRHRVRMGHNRNWSVKIFTDRELKDRFGPGTIEYQLLTKHQRAHTIIKAAARETSLA